MGTSVEEGAEYTFQWAALVRQAVLYMGMMPQIQMTETSVLVEIVMDIRQATIIHIPLLVFISATPPLAKAIISARAIPCLKDGKP